MRLVWPGQPLLITLLPLLVAVAGAVIAVIARGVGGLPAALRVAATAVVALCLWGSVVGFLKGLPVRQLAAGWLAYAGWLPSLLLGWHAGQTAEGRGYLYRACAAVVVFVVIFALLQQFGLLARDVGLEDYQEMRGAEDLGIVFRYTTGPFRTASVLSMFLAALAGVLITTRDWSVITDRRAWAGGLLLVAALLASVLAARRSGLAMLMGALIPFALLSLRRVVLRAALVAAALMAALVLFQVDGGSDVSREIRGKVVHSTVGAHVGRRLWGAFDADASAFSILSATGDGLGSHGQAARAGGIGARAADELLLHRHPVLHFGWYKDLLSFGPIGLLLQIVAFASLVVAAWPASGERDAGRFSVPGYLLAAAVVYFLVATSWIHSLSGGVLLGLAAGSGASRAGAARRAYSQRG